MDNRDWLIYYSVSCGFFLFAWLWSFIMDYDFSLIISTIGVVYLFIHIVRYYNKIDNVDYLNKEAIRLMNYYRNRTKELEKVKK